MAFTAFATALSALSAHATAVDVVGNNLANLSTPGYKSNTVIFRDLVAQSLGLGETQVGVGVTRPYTVRQFTQGSVQSTGGSLDAAIQGDGFFVLRDAADSQLFTRAGNFKTDAAGNLLTLTGERVQGWTAVDGVVNTNTAVTNLVVPVGALRAPRATTSFAFSMNLNASGVVGESTGTFSTPMEVVDSLGVPHVLTITATKTSANEWDYEVTIPGAEISGGAPPDPFSLGTGTLSFDSAGRLTTPPVDPGIVSIAIPGLTSGAADLAIDWILYSDDGTPTVSQYAQPSAMAAISQDGIFPSQLVKVTLADGGRLLATYSNGGVVAVGQLAIASVRNPDSLMAVGNNNLQATTLTSAAAVGVPQTGGRGKVVGSSLEASTVDIALEFATLIVLQRGYQANARVVTTVDDISQETINMKR